MRRPPTAIVAALLCGFGTAAAQPPSPTTTLARWHASVAEAAARPRPPLSTDIARELYRRVVVDQAARTALAELTTDLPTPERDAARQAIGIELGKIDADNSAYLETILPDEGWFDAGRDGEGVSGWAWLIVQHSPNWELKREALARLAPLVASGREPGSRYALLFDRVALHDGRPQRFGSQLECRGGRYRPSAIEDAGQVDARRATMGLEPLSVYVARVGERC